MKKVFLIDCLFALCAFLLSMSCSEKEVDSEQNGHVDVSDIIMEKSSVSVVRGSTLQLEIIVLPDNAVYDKVDWTTSDAEVATVNEDGVVTGVNIGTVVVRASVGSVYGECAVEVLPVDVQTITVDPEQVEIQEGGTAQLKVSILPEDADYEEVVWTSADPDIASVDENGLVTGVSPGNTEITVSAGSISDNCIVTVTGTPVSSIELSETELSLNAGETRQLTAEVFPEDAYDKTVVWASSDAAVASVSVDGLVTAVSAGNAVITASSGDVSAQCDVTVVGEINVGDWYYSDGTISTELDPSKTVLGIVFWVGDPTADDASLAREHPSCIHGLVMSLDEVSSMWQSEWQAYGGFVGDWVTQNATEYFSCAVNKMTETDLFNRIAGYNNTKAIEAFNAASENAAWPVDAVQKVVDYRIAVPAPDNSSDWYLPSIKELSLIVTGPYDGNIDDIFGDTSNRDILNGRLASLDGAQPLTTSSYWSSTESSQYSSGSAYVMNFNYSYPTSGVTYVDTYSLRYVLAF